MSPQKLTVSSRQLVEEARRHIREVDAAEALVLLDDDTVAFIDIRDVRERKREGYVPGSFHVPRGLLEFWVDPDSPYYQDIFGQDKTFIFYCAAGWRSALAVDQLRRMGFEGAAHITDGFSSWKAAGGEVKKDT